MPDINLSNIFQADLEKDNKQRFQQLFGNLQIPTNKPLVGTADFSNLGNFVNGEYKPNIQIQNKEPENPLAALDRITNERDPYAGNAMNSTSRTNLSNYDFNSFIETYDEKKYAKGKFGFDVNKSLAENESLYYQDWMSQNLAIRGLKSIGTFATNVVEKAGLKFAQGLGYIGSAINPFNYGENYFLKVADNGFSKFFADVEKGVNDDAVNRTFKADDYDTKGFFEKMTTSEFWGNEAADGFAFMASAMIPVGGIFGSIGKGLGISSKALAQGSKFLTLAEEASQAGKGTLQLAGKAGKVSNFLLGTKEVAAPIQWAYSVASESFFEAKGVVDDLNQRRKEAKEGDEINDMSEDEFNKFKSEKAANTFKANVALLSATNLFQTRLLFKALGKNTDNAVNRVLINAEGKAVNKEYTTVLGKFFNKNRIGVAGKNAFTGTLTEGYIEENAQLAIERVNGKNDREFLHFDPNSNLFLKYAQQYLGQTKQASTLFGGTGDTELATSIGLGGIMGGGMAIASSNIQKRKYDENGQRINYGNTTKEQLKNIFKGIGYGELKNESDYKNIVLADLENKYNKWQDSQKAAQIKSQHDLVQSKLALSQDESERLKLTEKLDILKKEYLATSIATQSKLKGLSDQTILAEQLEVKNPIAADILKQQAFTNYFLSAHQSNESLGNGILSFLNEVENTNVNTFDQLGKDVKTFDDKNYSNYKNIAETIIKNSNDKKFNNELFTDKSGLLTYKSLETLNENRKSKVLLADVNALIYKQAVDLHKEAIYKNKLNTNVHEINTLEKLYNDFIEQHAEIQQAEQNIKSGSLSEIEIKAEENRLKRAKIALDNLIKNKEHDFIDYSVLSNSMSTYEDVANFAINNLSNIFLQDKLGQLLENPNLTKEQNAEAQRLHKEKVLNDTNLFAQKLADNVSNMYAVTAYRNAANKNEIISEELSKMDGREFLDYLNTTYKKEEEIAIPPTEQVIEPEKTEEEKKKEEVEKKEEAKVNYIVTKEFIETEDGVFEQYIIENKETEEPINNETYLTREAAQEALDKILATDVKETVVKNPNEEKLVVIETPIEEVLEVLPIEIIPHEVKNPSVQDAIEIEKISVEDSNQNGALPWTNSNKSTVNIVEKKPVSVSLIDITGSTLTGIPIIANEYDLNNNKLIVTGEINKILKNNPNLRLVIQKGNFDIEFEKRFGDKLVKEIVDGVAIVKTKSGKLVDAGLAITIIDKDTKEHYKHKGNTIFFSLDQNIFTKNAEKAAAIFKDKENSPLSIDEIVKNIYRIENGKNTNIEQVKKLIEENPNINVPIHLETINNGKLPYSYKKGNKINVEDLLNTDGFKIELVDTEFIKKGNDFALGSFVVSINDKNEFITVQPANIKDNGNKVVYDRIKQIFNTDLSTLSKEQKEAIFKFIEANLYINKIIDGANIINVSNNKNSKYSINVIDNKYTLFETTKNGKAIEANFEDLILNIDFKAFNTDIIELLNEDLLTFTRISIQDYFKNGLSTYYQPMFDSNNVLRAMPLTPYFTFKYGETFNPLSTEEVLNEINKQEGLPFVETPVIIVSDISNETSQNKPGSTDIEIKRAAIIKRREKAIKDLENSLPDLVQGNLTEEEYRKATNKQDDEFNKKEKEIYALYDIELKELEETTSAIQSEIEAKKADIERRRQEELKSVEPYKAVFDAVKKANVDTDSVESLNKIKQDAIDLKIIDASAGNSFVKSNGSKFTSEENVFVTEPTNKINAKYDAELAALIAEDFNNTFSEEIEQNRQETIQLEQDNLPNIEEGAIDFGTDDDFDIEIGEVIQKIEAVEKIEKEEEEQVQKKEEAVVEKQEEKLDEVIEENITEEDIVNIAKEENIPVEDVKEKVKDSVKNAIDNNSYLQKLGKSLQKVVNKILKAFLLTGVFFSTFNVISSFSVYKPNVAIEKKEIKKDKSFNKLTSDGKIAYLSEIKNNKNFIIVDKPTATAYIYDSTGALIKDFPVLLGKDIGDKPNLADVASGKSTDAYSTPGRYNLKSIPNNEANKVTNERFHNRVLLIENSNNLALHEIYTGELEKRTKAINSPTVADNRQSWGCLNISAENFDKYVKNNLGDDSKIIITRDFQEEKTARFQIVQDQGSFVLNEDSKKQGEEWFKTNFPQIPVQNVEGLIKIQNSNEKALGVFAKSLIKMSSYANKYTYYHEAFHVAFNLFTTKAQQDNLLDEASKVFGIERDSKQSLTKFLTEFETGKDYYNQQTNDVQLEEKLAFGFEQYKKGKENATLSTKILNFFKDLLAKLQSFLTRKQNIRSLYNKINNGYFSTQKILTTATGVDRMSVYDSKGKELLNPLQASYFSNLVNSVTFSVFRSKIAQDGGFTVSKLKDVEGARRIYKNVRFKIDKILQANQNVVNEKLRQLGIIAANFDSFVEFHIKNNNFKRSVEEGLLKNLEADENYLDLSGSTEEERYQKEYDKAGNEQSIYESASENIKNMFSILPKALYTTEGIKEAFDENGFPVISDGIGLMHQVALEMEGEIDENTFMSKLFSDEMYKKIPELFFLKQLLPNIKENLNLTEDQVSIYNDFFRTFSKPKIDIKLVEAIPIMQIAKFDGALQAFYLYNSEEDYKNNIKADGIAYDSIEATETSKGAKNAIKQIATKFIYKDALTSKYFKIREEWVNNFISSSNVNQYISLKNDLKKLQSLPNITEDSSLQEIKDFLKLVGIEMSDNAYVQEEQAIINHALDIYKFLKLKIGLNNENYAQNPIGYLFDKSNTQKDKGKDSVKSRVSSLINIEAKYTNKVPSIVFKNSEGELQSLISEPNQLTRYKYEINKANNLTELFEQLPNLNNGFFLNSYVKNQLFDNKGNKKRNMSLDIHNYNGYAGTSSSKLSVRDKLLMDYGSLTQNNIIEGPRTEAKSSFFTLVINERGSNISNKYLSTATINNLEDYYNAHVEWMEANKSTNWGMFDFLSDEVKNNFNKDLFFKELNDKIEEFVKDTENLILENFDSMEEFFVQTHNSEVTDQKTALRQFVIKNLINDIEYINLFAGNLAYYKAFSKRIAKVASTGTPITNTSATIKYLEQQNNTLGNVFGGKDFDISKTIDTSVIKDNEKEYTSLPREVVSNIEAINKQYGLKPTKTTKELEAERSGLKEANIADGQAYINLDVYKQMLINRGGIWDEYMEKTYQYEILYAKDFFKKITPKEKIKFESLTKDIFSDGRHNLPILKFQQSGAIVDTDKPSFDKMSLAPMLPSVILENSIELTKMMMDSSKDNIAYIKHESATKLQYTGDANLINNITKNITSLYTADIKEQIKTSNDKDSTVILGSQFRKLLFSTFFSEGQAIHPEMQELYNNYKQSLKNLLEYNKEDLFNKLGVELIDGNIIVKDNTKFITELQREVNRRDLNINVKESLKIDSEGNLVNAFEFTGNAQIVNDLLFGLIDKGLRVQKVNGGQYVMFSNAYFKNLAFYDIEKNKIDGKLKITNAEVRVGLTGDFKNLLNKPDEENNNQPIGTLKRLNELLKNSKWAEKNKKLLTIVAYRIPTQEQNSMELLTIKEFLSPTAGAVIQTYDQIVSKSGADFDIDKLFLVSPAIAKSGTYIDESATEELNNTINNLKKQLEEFNIGFENMSKEDYKTFINSSNLLDSAFGTNGGIREEIKEQINLIKRDLVFLEDSKKQMLGNDLQQKLIDILSHPLQYEKLTKPNSANTIKRIAKENGIDAGMVTEKNFDKNGKLLMPQGISILGYAKGKNDIFNLMMRGKKHLGVYAVANTMLAIAQTGEFKLNSVGLYFNIFTPEEQERIIKDGQLALNNIYDVDGSNKNYLLSELITATVDSPSDPFYSLLGITYDNITVVNYLMLTGLPFDRIINLLNTGIIKKYNNLKERGYSTINILKQLDPRNRLKTVKLDKIEISPERIKELKLDQFDKIKKATPEYANDSYNLLKLYLHFETVANNVRELTQNYNNDTTKIATIYEAKAKEIKEEELYKKEMVKKTPLFTKNTITNLSKESIISLFNNNDIVIDIAKQLLPFLNDESTLQYFSQIINETKITNSLKRKLVKVLPQDFMQYIIENFNPEFTQNGITLRTSSVESGNNNLFIVKYLELKNEFPNAFNKLSEQYSIFNKIIFENVVNAKKPSLKNYLIKLNISNEDITQEQNTIIKELQSLLQFKNFTGKPIKELEDKEKRDTFVSAIQEFVKDFTALSFKQGGFSKTRFNHTTMLPLDLLIPEFKIAFNNFNKLSNSEKLEEAKNFYVAFKSFNPSLVNKTKEKALVGLKDYVKSDVIELKTQEKENLPIFDTLPFVSQTSTMTYAGIGSRETPQEVLDKMTEVAKYLEGLGYTLRSGGAKGADSAFEKGSKTKEIFLGNTKTGEKELQIAREIHPNPNALDNSKNPKFIWNLMARNTNQVFGKNLDIPVDFVIAWTQDGLTDYTKRTQNSGGTGQAIDMASRKNIPVINMFNENWRQKLLEIVNKEKENIIIEQKENNGNNEEIIQQPVIEQSVLKLTEDQQKVSDFVQEFLNKPVNNDVDSFSVENMIMVTGPGGTGKTFTITRAIKEFLEKGYNNINFAAPTHNAKRELTLSMKDVGFGKDALTNLSLFGIDYNPLSGKSSLKPVSKFWTPPIYNNQIIILDEYSMLGGDQLSLIKERLQEIKKEFGYNIKIIFSGDYGQIPPVLNSKAENDYMDGEITNLLYHNNKNKVVSLTKNMRAKFADVAEQGQILRSYIDRVNDIAIYKTSDETLEDVINDFRNIFTKRKNITENVNIYPSENKKEWLNNYLNAFRSNINNNLRFGVIVNYNNEVNPYTVNLSNYIRQQLFNNTTEKFVAGDLIMMQSNEFKGAKDLQKNSIIIGKEERLLIKNVNKISKTYNFEYFAKGTKTPKYFSITVPIFEFKTTNDENIELQFDSLNLPNTLTSYFKDNSSSNIEDLGLEGDIPQNKNQTFALISQKLADVSYGYVVNSHKVQGSSYDQTFVDEDNVLTAKNFKEQLQLLYTAYTRSKFKTHVKSSLIQSINTILSFKNLENQKVISNTILPKDLNKEGEDTPPECAL